MNIRHISNVTCKKCGHAGAKSGTVSQVVDDQGNRVVDRNPLDPVASLCSACGHETPLFHGSNFTPVSITLAKEGQTVRVIPEA